MAFTRSTTTTNVHSTLGNYPAEDNHLTAEQLKERFDAPATGLKSDINRLETELEATTSASSLGAGLITPGDTSAGNVQAKLEKIYTDLQAAALGEIPDNSIEEGKLVSTYANTLAKKNGTLQTNLNADMLDGYHASSFALKNNTLQTGLNAEKLGGSTLAQVMSAVGARTSGQTKTFVTTGTSSSTATNTFTIQTNCRFILILYPGTLSTDYSKNGFVGLFDCRENVFLFDFYNNSTDNVYIKIYRECKDSPSYRRSMGSDGTITKVQYLNGTLSITTKTSEALTIKCVPLDGLNV